MLNKVVRNLKKGTLIKNGSKALRNRVHAFVKYNNFFISKDPFRVITKRILHQYESVTNDQHEKIGNYFISKSIEINKNSIVYSLGVGTQIDFDLELEAKYGCKIHMFDPTPISIEFMKLQNNNNLLFHAVGIWKETTSFKFYKNKWGGSSSIIKTEDNVFDFEATCTTIPKVMEQHAHSTIDLIKIDIEGAGLEVLKHMLSCKIYPKQVIIELERELTNDANGQVKKIASIIDIVDEMSNYYTIFTLPQTGVKYYAFEFLFTLKGNGNNN